MKIHIIGMGLNGALLARFLSAYQDIEIVWSDNDSPHTAWRASTGAIYPAGSVKFGDDWACWQMWGHWYDRGAFPRALLERCSYWFNHRSTAPHEGHKRYEPLAIEDLGLRHAPEHVPSYHLNAQMLVPHQRTRHERVYPEHDEVEADWTIEAHGFGPRLHHAYWGWTRLVSLDYNAGVFGEHRPCFYFRRTRFEMAYAYPVPGTRWWYSGSNIISQKRGALRSLDMEPKYRKWKEVFEDVAGGHVTVGEEGEFIEGWRPAANEADRRWVVSYPGNFLSVRPLWNSGIRHFPHQLKGVCDALGLPTDCPLPPAAAT